ncbi:lipoprotein [Leptospira idonii]|uniref:Lipoprotein n=1 Tax=Leptospira idonii TaxID=1193500 RepID=A0A4V3JYD9_9LEPT|nr:lipoprotein [Leptospira idonii]TGN20116.1 lipoprotein [Leptospira idonii]
MNHFVPTQILTLLALSAGLTAVFNCKSAPAKEEKIVQETIVTTEKPEESPAVLEFTKAKEGFITDSLFQVAISSVLPDAEGRILEAKSIAEQKSLNLLKTYAPANISEKSKKELRDISKEGKLVDKNISLGGRYFFLYQINKRDLKRLVTTQLE